MLTAEQPAGADTQTLTIEINAAPAVTSDETATFTVGTAGSFTITTGGRPGAELSLGDALPPGLSFADSGDGTAVISGTPDRAGPNDHGDRDRRERRGPGHSGTDRHRARAAGDHQR